MTDIPMSTDAFEKALRAKGAFYHIHHPYHVAMYEGRATREQIQQAVRKVFDLRPAAIIDELDLKRPIYSKTAAYGHFGREDADFTWEATNMVDELKEAIKA